jgi:hypothetical protein
MTHNQLIILQGNNDNVGGLCAFDGKKTSLK